LNGRELHGHLTAVPLFLKNWWDLPPKYAYEFWVVSGVSVSNVQDSHLVRTTVEMGAYVLAVDRLHDDDNVGPVDELLRQEISGWFWHDSSGLCFPNPFPTLKEALGCWATL
jgi:hypothetical protein